jgi:uncharacterized membrane protein YebE (DUF533 family)
MSYKKDLEGFIARGTITPEEAIAFVIGKKHLRLPKLTEVNQLCDILNTESEDADSAIDFETVKGSNKAAMENLQAIIRNVTLTKKNLLQLWYLAKDKRKRQYMIALIGIGSVAAIGGIAYGIKTVMDKRNNKDQGTDTTGDILEDTYRDDIPQVEMEEVEI